MVLTACKLEGDPICVEYEYREIEQRLNILFDDGRRDIISVPLCIKYKPYVKTPASTD